MYLMLFKLEMCVRLQQLTVGIHFNYKPFTQVKQRFTALY